jgi:signal transduction histidine kinase
VNVRPDERDTYQAWLWGEVLLIGLLAAALALFVAYPSIGTAHFLPELRLVVDTVIMLAAALVAILNGARFQVDGRRLDLLLCCGFTAVAGSLLVFAIGPVLGGDPLSRVEAWAGVGALILGRALIALAPVIHGRVRMRKRTLGNGLAVVAIALVVIWGLSRSLAPSLPDLSPAESHSLPLLMTFALGVQALLDLLAVVGFGLRFRAHNEDLDRWLALGASLALFASLFLIFTPLYGNGYVSQGDFLRVLAYSVLLVGVWRAIRSSEFGRAVAEERARVAREIHDGLAQYLFAVSTHASMLEAGADLTTTLPQLKEAAAAAQQEAKFAVLALSSASGRAPFDAALRRYVEFLTADGALEVDLDIDGDIHLGPDEQIEVFRIVQEGLANARKHAGARRAEVRIHERSGERTVVVRDNGTGFEEPDGTAGQGLKNMRQRTASIGGAFRIVSKPGRGTALEITLRA